MKEIPKDNLKFRNIVDTMIVYTKFVEVLVYQFNDYVNYFYSHETIRFY